MIGSVSRFLRKGSLLLVAVVLAYRGLGALPDSRHPAIGTWRAANFEIEIGSESLASIQGVPCDWTFVDPHTLTISPRATIWSPEVNATIDGPFTFETIEEGRFALVDFLGYPLALQPVERGGGRDGETPAPFTPSEADGSKPFPD